MSSVSRAATPSGSAFMASPAGHEESFTGAGMPVVSPTTAPPELEAAQAAFSAKVATPARKYKTELLTTGPEAGFYLP